MGASTPSLTPQGKRELSSHLLLRMHITLLLGRSGGDQIEGIRKGLRGAKGPKFQSQPSAFLRHCRFWGWRGPG